MQRCIQPSKNPTDRGSLTSFLLACARLGRPELRRLTTFSSGSTTSEGMRASARSSGTHHALSLTNGRWSDSERSSSHRLSSPSWRRIILKRLSRHEDEAPRGCHAPPPPFHPPRLS